jgi:phosphoglycolate phosphatase
MYVGDHERDIAAGRNAGMTTIGVLFGYIDADENPADWQADFYVEYADELNALFGV